MKTLFSLLHFKEARFALVIAMTLTTVLFVSCDDSEPEVEYNHGFTVDASTEKDTLSLQENGLLSITLTPNRVVTNTQYTVEYTVTKGEGMLQTINEETIPTATPYALEIDANNTQQFQFVPQSEGDITLAFRITNNFGGAQEFEFTYVVNAASFETSFTDAMVNLNAGATKSLQLSVTQPTEDTNITYQAKLNTSSAIASFRLPNDTPIETDEWFDVVVGQNAITIQALDVGSYTAAFTVMSSDGVMRTLSLPITVIEIPKVSSILSGITTEGNDFKLYVKFEYTIDTSFGAAPDPKQVDIRFISGGTERELTVDFATAPRHPSRDGFIRIDEGNFNNTEDLERLNFYERRNSSYEVKITTSNDIESISTPAENRFRDYEFDENL